MCSNQSFYVYTVWAGPQRVASGERAGFEGEDSGRTEILPGTTVFQWESTSEPQSFDLHTQIITRAYIYI